MRVLFLTISCLVVFGAQAKLQMPPGIKVGSGGGPTAIDTKSNTSRNLANVPTLVPGHDYTLVEWELSNGGDPGITKQYTNAGVDFAVEITGRGDIGYSALSVGTKGLRYFGKLEAPEAARAKQLFDGARHSPGLVILGKDYMRDCPKPDPNARFLVVTTELWVPDSVKPNQRAELQLLTGYCRPPQGLSHGPYDDEIRALTDRVFEQVRASLNLQLPME